MLMTPKSQRQVCHCLPSQDTVPSQLKACRGDSDPVRGEHLCPEPEGVQGCRGWKGLISTKKVARGHQRSRRRNKGLWAVGCSREVVPSAHPSSQPQNRATLFYCPQSCPSLSLWVPWAGRGTVERCALLQKELMGERMSQTITVWKVSPGSLVK